MSGAHPSRISVLSNGSSIKCLKAYLVVVVVVVVVVYIVPSTLVDSRYIHLTMAQCIVESTLFNKSCLCLS